MSLTLVDGTVTKVTPAVAKEFEFLRSECKRLNAELAEANEGYISQIRLRDVYREERDRYAKKLAAMTDAKNKALDMIRLLLDASEVEGCANSQVARAAIAELEAVK
jgi:hypothetical protein